VVVVVELVVVVCWSVVGEVVEGLVLGCCWSVVDGLVDVDGLVCVLDGLVLCWSGVLELLVELPVWANAMPEASTTAKNRFFFILLLLRSFLPVGTCCSSPTPSFRVMDVDSCLERS